VTLSWVFEATAKTKTKQKTRRTQSDKQHETGRRLTIDVERFDDSGPEVLQDLSRDEIR